MAHLTAEQIAKRCQDLDGRANRTAINRLYRRQDQSHLPPVNNRFDVTLRAIGRVRRWMREAEQDLAGLEYAYAIEEQLTAIANGDF